MGTDLWASCQASWRIEWAHLRRSWLFLALALVQGLSFLVLVSLFALTGSRAPIALINSDGSVVSRQFVDDLKAAHDSFSIRPMTAKQARSELDAGSLVAIIKIPKGFGASVTHGETALVQVDLDNIDTDMTDDIERAVPSAIVLFGDHYHFPGIRVSGVEHDELPHDTGYIEYLVVSVLALDVLVVAGVVAGAAVAREWESGTAMAWKTAGSPTGFVLGKVGAAAAVGALGIVPPFLLVVLAYGVVPVYWGGAIATLAGCCVLFACFGAALGALTKRVVPAAALLFGLAIPLYMDSGALEPERFDGNKILVARPPVPAVLRRRRAGGRVPWPARHSRAGSGGRRGDGGLGSGHVHHGRLASRAEAEHVTWPAVFRLDLARWRRAHTMLAAALIPPLAMGLFLWVLTLSVGRQPVALVVEDHGPQGAIMANILLSDTDAYNLIESKTLAGAEEMLASQQVASVIVIPPTFDADVAKGTATVDFTLNNVDIDFGDDVRRAVARSVAQFDAPYLGFGGERLQAGLQGVVPNPYRIAIAELTLRQTNVGFLAYMLAPVILLVVLSVGTLGIGWLTRLTSGPAPCSC